MASREGAKTRREDKRQCADGADASGCFFERGRPKAGRQGYQYTTQLRHLREGGDPGNQAASL